MGYRFYANYLYAKNRAKAGLKSCAESFLKEERGEASIIAIILIILVVVALVAIFKDQLVEIINDLFKKIRGEMDI